MNTKISIIIPVYNAEQFLSRCIESILRQTYTNWETIFVNDGSTDNSLNILLTYAKKDSRIRIINKNNGGASSARNVGLDALQSEYFCFVDADDSIHPDFLKKVLEKAISNNCDLVVTGISFNGSKGNLYHSGLIELIPSLYIKCIHPGPCAKLYKREIVHKEQLRFCENMHHAEDYLFSISYALHVNKYYAIQEAMYNYFYENENSLDHRFRAGKMPYEQYLFVSEAPWRIFCRLLLMREKISHKMFYLWTYSLYSDLWRMYYSTCQYLTKNEQKKIYSYFKIKHNEFSKYIPWYRRICTIRRYPRLYRILKILKLTLKKLSNNSYFQ